jgi:hypothetical protein
MLAIQETMKQSDRLHIAMTIKVYDQNSGGSLMFNETAEVKKDGNKFLYKLGGNDMLMGEAYIVSVDRGEALITISKRSKIDEKKLESLFPVSIDSILSHYSPPQYLGQSSDGHHYRLVQKKGAIKQMDIYLDAQNGLPKVMEYDYQDGQHVLVSFGEFNPKPLFVSGLFDEGNYVKLSKGKATGVGTFSKYQVVANENQ